MQLLRHPSILLVLILIIVLLFGSRKLPDLAKSVGQSMKILKKDVKDLREGSDSDPAPANPPAEQTPSSPGDQSNAPGTGTPEEPRSTPDVATSDVEGDTDSKA